MKCDQPGCDGTIVDGYCDTCGLAPRTGTTPLVAPGAGSGSAPASPPPIPDFSSGETGEATMPRSAMTETGTGTARRASKRTGGRHRLGAGLVEIPPIPFRDPSEAVMANPQVPENRRFCSQCDEPVGRGKDDQPGRMSGFCRNCGTPFSFEPKLHAGDLVAGQYEVAGCLAHGGMGWVYLAKDRNVSDRWVVLKGLLNTGDQDAVAAALAERRFLAEVEHPNIVKIYNFVQQESSGYIVMEYVGGRSLKQIVDARRTANGGKADPVPPAQAIAYMLEILPAMGYLHEQGLLFCDFKLDNVIQTQHSLKLIDLGGVYRLADPASSIFGTVGYQAPEIAAAGPSVTSDLFTVARTLAMLSIEFKGYQSQFRYTLPAPDAAPLFAAYDSLYRLLAKATATAPDDRFQSAEEMADQLYGVLREVVAREEGRVVPAASTTFTPPLRPIGHEFGWRELPRPQVATDDAGAAYLATLTAADPAQLIAQLRAAPDKTLEVELRLVAAMIEAGEWSDVDAELDRIERDDPWEWRASWYRGIARLAQDRPADAQAAFTTVYRALPGELAPKLALGVAAEALGAHGDAARWFEIVARTDPSFTVASFGLARCRLEAGDRTGALDAYAAVPDTSSSYIDAQTATIRCLGSTDAGTPQTEQLLAAGRLLDSIELEGEQRLRLSAELLQSALVLTSDGPVPGDTSATLLGCRLVEPEVRKGLERTYRALARGASSQAARIELVDQANQVRPWTWT
jgi:serine/threonine-protein kinase PknG